MSEELREAAKLLYPGLFSDEAYRRHPRQIDRVAALIADADNWRRATTGDPTEPLPLAMQARELVLRVRELEAQVAALHEWRCPSCGATTRARMADR